MKLDYQNNEGSASKKMFSFYAIIMLLLYIGYVVMDYVRLSRGEGFGNLTNLSEAQLASVQQLGIWTIGFEVSFALLFLIGCIVTVYLYRTNENLQYMRIFTMVNIGLFLLVGIIGAGLSFIIPIPIGNLIQVIVIPTYFLIALVLYAVYAARVMRKDKEL